MTTVVNHLIYDTFGKVTSESNPATRDVFFFDNCPFLVSNSLLLFPGGPFDSDTQLQNNLNRWYDAHVGRWLSEDPIGFAGGDGNLYRYVGNSVLHAIDPVGHWRWPWNWGKPSRPPVPVEPPQLIPPFNQIPAGENALKIAKTFSHYFRAHRTLGAACEAVLKAALLARLNQRCGEAKHLEAVYASYCAGMPWGLG